MPFAVGLIPEFHYLIECLQSINSIRNANKPNRKLSINCCLLAPFQLAAQFLSIQSCLISSANSMRQNTLGGLKSDWIEEMAANETYLAYCLIHFNKLFNNFISFTFVSWIYCYNNISAFNFCKFINPIHSQFNPQFDWMSSINLFDWFEWMNGLNCRNKAEIRRPDWFISRHSIDLLVCWIKAWIQSNYNNKSVWIAREIESK